MNYLVCIKQVPGTGDVEIDKETGRLKRSDVPARMNPFDRFALEIAFELRERFQGEVHVLTMGPPNAKEVLEESLCKGADRCMLLSDRCFAGADVLATARALSGWIKAEKTEYDVIICGKQTTDGDTAQVGPEMAEMLDIPHAANVKKVIEVDERLTVMMNLEHSEQVQDMSVPCLIPIEKGEKPPKLPNVKKKDEIDQNSISVYSVDALEDCNQSLYGAPGSPTKVESIYSAGSTSSKKTIEEPEEILSERLVELLVEKRFL